MTPGSSEVHSPQSLFSIITPPRAAPDAKTKKYIVSLVFRDKIIRYFNCFQNCPTLIKPRSEAVASITGLCTLGHIATPSYQARFKDFWRD